jgi:4-diphosphocytidyl-2-C-methyl-D-erythritol kinase
MALLALAQLWKLPSSPADLLPLAARLGSDVPFFLTGGTALGIGRGEEVYALPDAPPLSVLIVVPGRGMPTVEAYARLDQRLTGPISLHRMTTLVHGIVDGRLGEGLLYNVFEEVQPHEEGEVAALRRVSAGMGKGRLLLAGSGSAWVALFSNHEDAREAGRRLSRRGVKGILTQSLARRDYWERSLPATAKEFRP